jgi:hypothetical protein
MSWADVKRGMHSDRVGRCDGDSGFSVVELLVALTILLITLVALVRLATTSSFMVSTSRQRSAMVNAAAGYLDRVRQEPFLNVGTPGGDPAGTLGTVVTTETPYVITIEPTVTWGRPENTSSHLLKTVVLNVTSRTLSGGSEMGLKASALVADVGVVGLPTPSAATTPSCVIVSPASATVVWGSTVSITASATVTGAGRTLLWMDMIDGVQSLGSTVLSGTSAQHTWSWNTTGAREGNHSLFARATDSSNRVGNSAPVTLLVDNQPPATPTGLAMALAGDSAASVWWTASTDGTDIDGITPLPASHYVLYAYKQPADPAVAGDYTRWTAFAGLSPASIANPPVQASPFAISPVTAFSRLAVAVRSSSPDRGAVSGLLSNETVVTGITQYAAAGTWTVALSGGKCDVTAALRVPTGPTFPWSGTATTTFYRLTSPTQPVSSGTVVGSVSSAYPSWSSATVTNVQSRVTSPVRYWYVAQTTMTPAGYGGTPVTVRSSVIGPGTDFATVGSRAMVFAQW